MNYYKTSSGERIAKSIIDVRVRKAKGTKIRDMIISKGYIACEECGRSGGDYLDCSHDLSVDQCQKQGKSELAYDVNNITIRCRACHIKHD